VKYSKRPPPYNERMNKITFKVLPLAMACHLFFSIFVYTTSQIYSVGDEDSDSILNKMLSPFGITFLSGTVIVVAFVLLRPFVEKFILRVRGEKSRRWEYMEDTSFTDVKERLKKNYIVTYDIMENWEYSDAIELVNKKINTEKT